MTGVLYARSGGAWVPVSSAGGGATGAAGPPGAPGASTRQSDWIWVAAAVSTAQASGHIGASSATATSATYIELHPTDSHGASWTGVITGLVSGNGLYIRQANDPSAWVEYTITGTPTGDGTNYRIPVSVRTPVGNEPADGSAVLVGFSVPVGVAGPTGPPGADGADGQRGTQIFSGTTAPVSSIGMEGDWYFLKTATTFAVYGPKTGGAWPAGLSLSAGGTAPPPGPPPTPPPTSTDQKFMFGLVDRDGTASAYNYRTRPQYFGGIVGNVMWQDIEPTTQGTFVWTAIDNFVTEANTYGLKLRIRLYIGIDVQNNIAVTAAPTWLLTRCGSVTVSDPNWSGATSAQTVKFWDSNFLPAWKSMITAFAARYDNNTTLVEIGCMPGALIGGETMIQRYDNQASLLAGGYPGWEADQAIQRQAMDHYAATLRKTGLYYSLNAFQKIGTAASVDDSITLANYGLGVMGNLMRPANNSVNAGGGGDSLDDDRRGGSYRTIYTQMQQVWTPAGVVCQVQTDNPTNIAAKGGNLNDTIKYCAFIGAHSVEMPVSYTSETNATLAAWQALYPTAPPVITPPPPSSSEILTVPNTNSVTWCFGWVKGCLAGDGQAGAGAWNYGGGVVYLANELRRCAAVCNANGIPMIATGANGSPSCGVSYTYLPTGFASLMPSANAPSDEIQGWASGIMETEAASTSTTYLGGLYWMVEDNYTGVVGTDAQLHTTMVSDNFNRLGCASIVQAVSGGWQVLVPQDHWDVLRVWPYFDTTRRPPAPPPTTTHPRNIMVIAMENRTNTQVLDTTVFTKTNVIFRQYAWFTNLFGPFGPNAGSGSPAGISGSHTLYLALIAGSNYGVLDDTSAAPGGPGTGLTGTSLLKQLDTAGISWKAYAEALPTDVTSDFTINGGKNYMARHYAPVADFAAYNTNPHPANVKDPGSTGSFGGTLGPTQPLWPTLLADLNSGSPPRFVWFTPTPANQGHANDPTSGPWLGNSTTDPDKFLDRILTAVMGTAWFADHGTIIVWWDEGDSATSGTVMSGAGRKFMFVISATALGRGNVTGTCNDFGILADLETAYGLTQINHAADPATSIGSGLLTPLLG